MQWLRNFWEHPKTTLAGTVAGAVVLAAGGALLKQAGCDFSHIDYGSLITIALTAIGTGGTIGGVMTDK